MRTLFTFVAAIAMIGLVSFADNSPLSVSSPAFHEGGMIPVKYTCGGAGISPALEIGKIPAGAKSLALIVHDPDAPTPGGYTHWVMWNIPTDGKIPENYKGAVQGLNGMKQNGYKGMCPPSGVHNYHFRVYALNTKLTIDKNTDKEGLEGAMRGHIIGSGELVGQYQKGK